MSLPARPWIFFDAGNVLVSDDPSGCQVLRALYAELLRSTPPGTQPETPAEFMARRTEFTRNGGQLWKFVASHEDRLPGQDWRAFQKQVRASMYRPEVWSALSPPIPGMDRILPQLKAAGFRLGLVANQPPSIEWVFRRRGLWHLFDIHAVSDSLGISKPDERIFRWAVDRAGTTAEQVIMVGDRIDNDIAPAKKLGMATAWIVLPTAARGWNPTSDLGRAYLESVTETSVSLWQPATPDQQPDFRAETPSDLLKGLLKLGFEKR
jgi:HAD superfamily hydrolase (TIGR01509 family)